MDYIIVITSDPDKNSDFEQGLEIAMTLSDLELKCSVSIEGDFLSKIENCSKDSVYLKKLKQLELFDIPLISARAIPFSYCTVKDVCDIRQIYKCALTIICF